jgi:hypothetical protein
MDTEDHKPITEKEMPRRVSVTMLELIEKPVQKLLRTISSHSKYR